MIIIEKPYASDLFLNLISKSRLKVLNSVVAKEMAGNIDLNWVDLKDVEQLDRPVLCTNSENALGWISENINNLDLQKSISKFKNKVIFREAIADLYPNFVFKEVKINDLMNCDISDLDFPFILKPAVGFFSLGVYKIGDHSEFMEAAESIHKVEKEKNIFPSAVYDASSFIIEQNIEGEEYAIDAYYDKNGDPVILNVLKHEFADDGDVSDRVYLTSGEIIRHNLTRFTQFLKNMGRCIPLKNFPLHVEIRETEQGILIPIEVNPLRFGGFCTTADLGYYAHGINSYEYFFEGKQPDWDQIIAQNGDKIFALIVLDNSTGVDGDKIESFDYDKLKNHFSSPIEVRKMDYKRFPLFGFVFAETSKRNFSEINYILHSDLREFICAQQ